MAEFRMTLREIRLAYEFFKGEKMPGDMSYYDAIKTLTIKPGIVAIEKWREKRIDPSDLGSSQVIMVVNDFDPAAPDEFEIWRPKP